MNAPRPNRVRLRFDKFGRIRFTSHRDVARVWERALRRTGIPVAYSEGFSPRPRLRFGLALGTSHESCGEYLDIDLAPGVDLDCDGLPALLSPVLPDGMDVVGAAPVAPGLPSLQEAVTSCTWLVELPETSTARAAELVEATLSATELPVTRERKGKTVTDDVRPAILHLCVSDERALPEQAQWPAVDALVEAELATQPRTCRPGELLAALDDELSEGRVLRLHQWTLVDGIRTEPLPLPPGRDVVAAASTAHTEACAS